MRRKIIKIMIKKDKYEKPVKWKPIKFNLSSGTWIGWTYTKENKDDKEGKPNTL